VLDHTEFGSHEDRIRLPTEGRAKNAVMHFGHDSAELGVRRDRPDSRRLGYIREGGHAAPVVELGERPRGHFLEAENGRPVVACEPDHLLQERLASGRLRIPVEEVPGPDKQAFYCTADVRIACGPAGLHSRL
jgi:hypothetical protein